jgi:hypothetical protein
VFKPIDYNKHFVIGTPLVPWKVAKKEHLGWLNESKLIKDKFPNVTFFAALELDADGLEPYTNLINILKDLKGKFWTYTINDYEQDVTSHNRWIRIETGRNLIREFTQRKRVVKEHYWGEDTSKENLKANNNQAILYVDSDIVLTLEIVEKLMEIDRPLVGVNVPVYNLKGKVVNKDPRIEEHWNTAGMLLVNAPAYYDLPWYHNSYLNLSDDPTFQHLSERLPWGQTWVRKDVSAHHKGDLRPVERRELSRRKI